MTPPAITREVGDELGAAGAAVDRLSLSAPMAAWDAAMERYLAAIDRARELSNPTEKNHDR